MGDSEVGDKRDGREEKNSAATSVARERRSFDVIFC